MRLGFAIFLICVHGLTPAFHVQQINVLKDQQQGKLYNTRTPHESKKRGWKGLQALYRTLRKFAGHMSWLCVTSFGTDALAGAYSFL